MLVERERENSILQWIFYIYTRYICERERERRRANERKREREGVCE